MRWWERAALALAGVVLSACDGGEPASTPAVAGDGRAAWLESCAVCHGESGRGDGPFAALLRAPPPDLTLLAQRNGGNFPERAIARAVDGRNMPGAHGTADMPVWGREWRATGDGEAAVKARLIAVTTYLESLQRAP
jgi:mono/diheme cytochrome c family protein